MGDEREIRKQIRRDISNIFCMEIPHSRLCSSCLVDNKADETQLKKAIACLNEGIFSS